MAINIFVYGTLKRGGCNNHILAGCDYIGKGRAVGCVLIDMGACPGMMPGRAFGNYLSADAAGEIYSVADDDAPALLRHLDYLENEGTLYIRVKMNIWLERGEQVECVTYLYLPPINPDKIFQDGSWPVRNNQTVQAG